MTRSRIRRLHIAGADFVCSVRASTSATAPGGVVFSAYATGHRLRLHFTGSPGQGRLAGDAGLDHGSLRTADGRWINLHRPAVMRALVLAGLARAGAAGAAAELDGWRVLDAATLPDAEPDAP
ncbi:hypothetical protein [Stenotrophomonas maltophilia]|uniref:hypothetical protein n=1 Tax=Stenotrophomonas maltophilia TaxID=40324 RepID=UPI0039F70B3D